MTAGTVLDVEDGADTADDAPEAHRRRRLRPGILAIQLSLLVAALGAWELAHRTELVRPLILSSPGQVWDAFYGLVSSGVMLSQLGATMEAVVIALILSSSIGISVGLLLGVFPRVEEVFTPFLNAMNSAPRIAFAPVFIVAFGIGTAAKVALAFSVTIFIMILNARAGVHAAEHDVVRLLRVMGANKRQLFTKLLLPVAVPSIFVGVRLGLIYSLLAVVTSEMISSRDGLGQLIARFSANFQLDSVYAVIAVLIVVGTALNALMGLLERRLLSWQPERHGR